MNTLKFMMPWIKLRESECKELQPIGFSDWLQLFFYGVEQASVSVFSDSSTRMPVFGLLWSREASLWSAKRCRR